MAGPSKKSKKQSSGKPGNEAWRKPDFVIYLDENLHNCKPIHEVLTKAEVRFERHGAHWPDGTLDSEWLPFVGLNGWIILSKDKNFRYNEYEKQLLHRYKVREFFFACGHINKYEMAEILQAVLVMMQRFCANYEAPFAVSITKERNLNLRYGGTGKPKKLKSRPDNLPI